MLKGWAQGLKFSSTTDLAHRRQVFSSAKADSSPRDHHRIPLGNDGSGMWPLSCPLELELVGDRKVVLRWDVEIRTVAVGDALIFWVIAAGEKSQPPLVVLLMP